MRRFIIPIICSLFFLISCGTNNGPEIDSGKVTQTLTVPGPKGFFVSSEAIMVFAGSPDDQKTLALWTQVRPVVLRVISENPQVWRDFTPKMSGMFSSGDPLAGINSNSLCGQIKRLMGQDLGENRIERCGLSKFEVLPDK